MTRPRCDPPSASGSALKLGLAFTGVLAVMLASLVVVLQKSSEASHAYERAIAWNVAVEGAARQAAGRASSRPSQALYVATGEPRYKREWQAGVDAAEKAGAAVEALHDPSHRQARRRRDRADRKHDASVNDKLFPAMAAATTPARTPRWRSPTSTCGFR